MKTITKKITSLLSFGFVITFILFTGLTNAQLTGIKNIPGDYATLELAIADLNAVGVGTGGVTLNLVAGNPQTAPAGGYVIGGTGSAVLTTTSSTNQVIVQGNGNAITAFTPQASGVLHDAIFEINGADWITITGFTMLENPANTITAAGTNDMTEFGVVLFYESVTNGCQNITITNNTIDLDRTYQNTFGIYSNSTHSSTAMTTSATATGPEGGNHTLIIQSNIITDVNMGIVVVGPTAAADMNNVVSIGGSIPTGNTITNFGTTPTFSGYANVSGTVNGILIRNSITYDVSYNTITSSVGGMTVSGTMNGIQQPAFSSVPTGLTFTNQINHNNISLQPGVAGATIIGINCPSGSASTTSSFICTSNNFTNFGHTVAGTGAITFILNASTHLNQNISGNTFTDMTVNTTGSVTFISNTNTPPAGSIKDVNFNSIVTGFTKTGAGGTVLFFTDNGSDPAGSTNNTIGNSFGSVSVTGATAVTGISNTNGGSPTKNVGSNVISNISGGTGAFIGLNINFDGGTTTVTGNSIGPVTNGGAITGINFGTSGAGVTYAFSNSFNGLTGTGTGIVSAINAGGSAAGRRDIYKHDIYNLQNNNAGGSVFGIIVSSGTINVFNNFIRDLKAPVCSLATDGVRGISITSITATSGVRIYYNSIYLNAVSTGTNFSSSAIFHTNSTTGTTAELDMRNNVFVNVSVPQGTGVTAAFRRSAVNAALNNYSTLSNNNDFYAGTPGPNNLIFFDGTNADQTIADFKARVTPRETSSFSENPPFLDPVTPPYNLHMNPSIATQTESGGTPVSSPIAITLDFDGDSRNATTPDVGADEFNGIPLDLSAPVISYTPLLNTGSTSARILNATITDLSGVPTSGIGLPVLYWKKNYDGTWTGATAGTPTGSEYPFTFGAGVVMGDTVFYYIVAQDNAVPPNVGAFPSGGAGGFTANPPAASIPPTNPSFYLITNTALAGDYTVGLLAFNSITGKNIVFEKSVRKVLREAVTEEITNSKNNNQNEATNTSINVNGTKTLIEVEEISWIPMENGLIYEGDLFVKKVDYPSLNFPAGVDGIYATITAAVADLNLRGVSAPVNFLLTDPTYLSESFPIIINVTNEAKPTASNVVTFKPNTGVIAAVSGPSAASQLLRILSSHIIVDGSNSGGTTRDLTFENTSATSPQVILIGSIGTTPIINVTVKNCNIINGVNTSTPLIVSDGTVAGNAGWFNNITIQNNTIQKAYIGSYSIAVVSAGNGSGLSLLSNDLTTSGANSVRFVGLYLQGIDGANVSDNQIGNFDGATSEDDRGIWLASGTRNSIVQRNKIYSLKYTGTGGYGAYGVAVSSATMSANNSIVNNVIYNLSGDGWNYTSIIGDNPHGIYIFSTQSGINVYYNSIYLYGNTLNQTNALSTGICVATGSVADIQDNNVVNNLGLLAATGYGSAGIFVQSGASQLLPSNYNNWYVSPTGSGAMNVGQIATTGYTTLAAWQAASSQDLNSISADPQFVSETDLRPALGSPVLAAGTPIAGITTDFLGVTRSATNPTIGAYEQGAIVPLAPGDYTIGVTLFRQMTGMDITFERRVRTIEIEETVIDPVKEEQVGIYEETTEGTVTIQSPASEEELIPVTVKRKVEQEYYIPMLNGEEYQGKLYYELTPEQQAVHRIAGVYPTITAAMADAVLKGVAGPVRFILLDATYPSETFPIVISEIAGASAVNTVTLMPDVGVTSLISGSPTNTFIFDFNGVDYFIIDGRSGGTGSTSNLTIQNLTTTGASSHTIRMINGATNNIFRYVTLVNNAQLTAGPRVIDINTSVSDPAGNSFNTIEYCNLNGGRSGIGFAGTAVNPNSNNVIMRNKIFDWTFAGVWLSSNTMNTTIDENEFYQSTLFNVAGSGINLATGGTINIRGNIFRDLQNTATTSVRGVSGTPGANSTVNIVNNFFSLTQDNGTKTSIYAIQLSGTTEHTANVYYNTAYLAGTHTGGTANQIISAGFVKGTTGATSVTNMKNNVCVNDRTAGLGTAFHCASFVSVGGTMDIDYNVWFATGGDNSRHAYWAGTGYNDLTAYRGAATPNEQNTFFSDVEFVSGTDLHIDGTSIGDPVLGGTPIAGITTDIDGETRDVAIPYRGADEVDVQFVPVLAPSNLVAVADTFFIELFWTDNSVNEGGFIIERKDGDSTSGNPYVAIDTVGRNVAMYVNTGLPPSTEYTYRVKAINQFEQSGYSNQAEAETNVPVELTSFSASVSSREILLSWTTGSEINNRGFEVERKAFEGENSGQWEKLGFVEGFGTTTDEQSYSFSDDFKYISVAGTISYRLKQIDFDGTYHHSKAIEVDVDFTPKEYTLYQNYPNPFNPSTTIKYALPFDSNVRIQVYNLLGELVTELVNTVQEVGFYDYVWNANSYASGIYFYTINAKSVDGQHDFNTVKKMMLVK
jgi:hypothetical protein